MSPRWSDSLTACHDITNAAGKLQTQRRHGWRKDCNAQGFGDSTLRSTDVAVSGCKGGEALGSWRASQEKDSLSSVKESWSGCIGGQASWSGDDGCGSKARCADGSCGKDNLRGDAFVAMLHGTDPHWLVCALLLGYDLQRLCPSRERILLIDKASPWSEGDAAQALACFWSLKRDVFKCMPKATKTQRHNLVFNKIRVLSLDVCRTVFLDLDILVRSSKIEELFDVPAPAGKLHGAAYLENAMTHGDIIDKSAFECDPEWWPWSDFCINTGVLRLDPPQLPRDRKRICDELLEKAAKIPESQATYLPEQYFLVQELKGPWRHVGNKYNWEVGPSSVIDGRSVYHCSKSCGEWADCDISDVVIFHFSGNDVEPYNYLDLQPADALVALQERFRWRDGRDAVATAVIEWCQALRTLWKLSGRTAALENVHKVLDKRLQEGELAASARRDYYRSPCNHCLQWSAECFDYWWSAGRLCADCILLSQCSWMEKPGCLQEFEGEWVDAWTEDAGHLAFVSVVQTAGREERLQVQYRMWSGSMSLAHDGRIVIEWDPDEHGCDCFSTEGCLEGHVIRWDSGACWAHIFSTW